MGLLSLPLRLPLLPITALIRLAEVLEDQAQRQLDADVRRRLEEAEEAQMSGQATDEEVAWLEEQALRSLTGWRPGTTNARGEQAADG